MIAIVARLKARPGKRAQFIASARHIVETTRNEPGNISYELYASIDDEEIFIFLEEWKDSASLATHVKTPQFAELGKLIQEYTAEKPRIKKYETAD